MAGVFICALKWKTAWHPRRFLFYQTTRCNKQLNDSIIKKFVLVRFALRDASIKKQGFLHDILPVCPKA